MNSLKKITFCLFSFLLVSATVFAQDANWLPALKQRMAAHLQKHSPEKIHIQTDRSFYLSGDTVWFKAYLVDAAGLKPVKGFSIIHLTLFNQQKKAIMQQKLLVQNGLAPGQFILADTLKTGKYVLQAYTNWMRNAGPDFYLNQTIEVTRPGKKQEKNGSPSESKSAQIDLQFFPEGGSLVAGLKSKIGFKALAPNGLGTEIAGNITDEAGKVITTFKSTHAGMGSLWLQPESNKTYSANLLANGQIVQTIPLPIAKPSGIALTANLAADSDLVVTLAGTSDRFGANMQLVLQSRGEIFQTKELTIAASGNASATFTTKELPAGIATLTVFNSNGKPEAERLVFIHKPQNLSLHIKPAKNIYGPREQVKLLLETKDLAGKPVAAELALSAVDWNQAGFSGNRPTILSNLLLTSDLAGFVEDPGFYFEHYPEKKEALDNLMLTQGWRQFSWTQVKNNQELPVTHLKEETSELRGQVLADTVPISKAVIYYLDLGTNKTNLLVADNAGNFKIENKAAVTNLKLFYQVWQQGKLIKNAILKFNNATIDTVFKAGLTSNSDSLHLNKLLFQRHVAGLYADQKVRVASVNNSLLATDTVLTPDRNYRLTDYNFPLGDVEEIFKEIVPSVRIKKKKGEYEARVLNVEKKEFYRGQPLYFVDGKPTYNNDLVLRMNSDLVKNVQVFYSSNTLQPFGYMGNYGVVSIRTKKGNFSVPDVETQNQVEVQGFMMPRTFYVPKFLPANKPDFRPVIYWNPVIKTDANGQAEVVFPTSDAISSFRIYAEGITTNGLIGTQEITINSNSGQ